jgi:hypothetical protein
MLINSKRLHLSKDLLYIGLELKLKCLSDNFNTYVPHTLYPQRASRGISDIPPRRLGFTKIT